MKGVDQSGDAMEIKQHLYILNGHEVVPAAGVAEWAEWLETGERRVAEDYVGKTRVSTIFIGVEMNLAVPPQVF